MTFNIFWRRATPAEVKDSCYEKLKKYVENGFSHARLLVYNEDPSVIYDLVPQHNDKPGWDGIPPTDLNRFISDYERIHRRRLKFGWPEVQEELANELIENKEELFIFVKRNDLWEKLSQKEIEISYMSKNQNFWYTMIGTSEGDWVFAPSMENKEIVLYGKSYKIVDAEYNNTGSCFLLPFNTHKELVYSGRKINLYKKHWMEVSPEVTLHGDLEKLVSLGTIDDYFCIEEETRMIRADKILAKEYTSERVNRLIVNIMGEMFLAEEIDEDSRWIWRIVESFEDGLDPSRVCGFTWI